MICLLCFFLLLFIFVPCKPHLLIFLRVSSFCWQMTLTSLAMFPLSPPLLTILLPNQPQWVQMFNFAIVLFGPFLTYPLVPPLIVFVALSTTLEFQGSPLFYVIFFLLFVGHFGGRHSPCNVFLSLKDVQIALRILSQCFAQRPFLFCVSLPLPSFCHQLVFFNSTLMQVFERLLGPSFFEFPEVPLVHRQVLLPISCDGIGFIFEETIVLTTYLRTWVFITLIIAFRFLLDSQCSFWRLLGQTI